jgi:N-acetylmuramic acid 6-phosphate etherase
MKNTTESDSLYNDLDSMSTELLIANMNKEDMKIARVIKKKSNQIAQFIDVATFKLTEGGRLFYIGAGTSGRLGVLDASEIFPTFGVKNQIIGIIAGGDYALKNPVESAEDDLLQSWKDLEKYDINKKDVIFGISTSGTTPYVLSSMKNAKQLGITTGSLVCNKNSIISKYSDHPLEIVVGPEFITGSTRMKAGTATKMVLNMISTSIMIKLGKVKGNKMIDMQLVNEKLVKRGIHMIQQSLNVDLKQAEELLNEYGSVRAVLDSKTTI